MAVYRLNILLALLTAVFLAGISSAKEPNIRGRVTFTVIPLSSLPYGKLYYRNGAEFIQLEVRKGMSSEPYVLNAADFFELYPDRTDPEEKYRLIGRAPFVAGTRKILYFLRKRGSSRPGALPVALFGVDDSESTFPDSSFRFINFINAPLGIEFNKKRFGIKPGQSTVRKLELPEEGSFAPLSLRI